MEFWNSVKWKLWAVIVIIFANTDGDFVARHNVEQQHWHWKRLWLGCSLWFQITLFSKWKWWTSNCQLVVKVSCIALRRGRARGVSRAWSCRQGFDRNGLSTGFVEIRRVLHWSFWDQTKSRISGAVSCNGPSHVLDVWHAEHARVAWSSHQQGWWPPASVSLWCVHLLSNPGWQRSTCQCA